MIADRVPFRGVRAADDQPRRWTLAARLEAVIATRGLDETTRSAWCREHGVFPTALDAWKRDAIGGLGEPAGNGLAARQEQRRVKELECANCGARTRRWPKRLPCSCCQKNARRSSTKAGTHEPPGRSLDPDPGDRCRARQWRAAGGGMRVGRNQPAHRPALAEERWTDPGRPADERDPAGPIACVDRRRTRPHRRGVERAAFRRDPARPDRSGAGG